jgi:hypothetical protein
MKKLISIALAGLLCLSVLSACTGGGGGNTSEPPSSSPSESSPGISAAADYLETRLKEFDRVLLYVYKDFADGMNNFTQKAWIGDSSAEIPGMDEAAQGFSGISGIAAELDLSKHSWGGYIFGNSDAALDLTGAAKLIFYAKGETGKEHVEFFMGGLGWDEGAKTAQYPDSTLKVSLGTVSLTGDWKKYEISLSGKDLSRIGCGFGWVIDVANNPGLTKVKFYLDDIHYELAEPHISPMFLQSYDSAELGTDDAIINNFAYLYDNAATVLALSYTGKHERARQIADALVYALENDRYYSDGRMRNAYAGGNPRGFNVEGKEFAKLPGFYDTADMTWYEDYYAVSTSTGNLAWTVLALCEVYKNAPEHEEYLRSAQKIGDFILTLKDEKGGFTGGYEGWEGNETKVTYKSTEHNIDLIRAYRLLNELSGDAKYADASDYAKAFVLSMYDAEKHYFYTGTGSDGVTVSKEVLPLDCNTWATLALGDDFKDGKAVMEFVERSMTVGKGYGFNDDRDDGFGVWYEGTAGAALAYKQLGDEAKYADILAFMNENALPDGSITAADRDVTTGFMVSGTDIPWKYRKRVHVGATAWLAFAQLGVNPFASWE